MVYSSPADIFRQQQEHATTERETSAEERGGEGAMKGVHWDPNLVSYSQQAEQAETTSTLTSMSQVMPRLLQNLTQQPYPFTGLLRSGCREKGTCITSSTGTGV